MDETKLAELEALAAAATPGPWTDDGDAQSWDGEEYGRSWVETSAGRWCQDVPETGAAMAQQGADARFIVAARTAVPELVAEVRRLRALLPCASCGHLPSDHRDSLCWEGQQFAFAQSCHCAGFQEPATANDMVHRVVWKKWQSNARAHERERCAKVADDYARRARNGINREAQAAAVGAEHIARDLRALPDEPGPEGT